MFHFPSVSNSSPVLPSCLRIILIDYFNAVEILPERDKRLSRIDKLHITRGIFDFSKFAPLFKIVRNLNLVFFPLGRIESNTTEADVCELDHFLLNSRYSVQIKNRTIAISLKTEPIQIPPLSVVFTGNALVGFKFRSIDRY